MIKNIIIPIIKKIFNKKPCRSPLTPSRPITPTEEKKEKRSWDTPSTPITPTPERLWDTPCRPITPTPQKDKDKNKNPLMNIPIGNRQAQREMFLLQLIYHSEKEEDVADHDLCRETEKVPLFDKSMAPKHPFLYTIWVAVRDLREYGLITIQNENNWPTYRITEKGKQYVEYMEGSK